MEVLFFFPLLSTVCVFMHMCTCLSLYVCLGAPTYRWSAVFPTGHTRPLCVFSVSSSYRSAANPGTQGYMYVFVCVCVCALVFVLLLICVLDFFHFNPIWVGQVGHCLLHDPGKLCQKGICTVDRTKYVYEEATMVTVWCNTEPSSKGVVLTFIYLIAIWTKENKWIRRDRVNEITLISRRHLYIISISLYKMTKPIHTFLKQRGI